MRSRGCLVLYLFPGDTLPQGPHRQYILRNSSHWEYPLFILIHSITSHAYPLHHKCWAHPHPHSVDHNPTFQLYCWTSTSSPHISLNMVISKLANFHGILHVNSVADFLKIPPISPLLRLWLISSLPSRLCKQGLEWLLLANPFMGPHLPHPLNAVRARLGERSVLWMWPTSACCQVYTCCSLFLEESLAFSKYFCLCYVSSDLSVCHPEKGSLTSQVWSSPNMHSLVCCFFFPSVLCHVFSLHNVCAPSVCLVPTEAKRGCQIA